MNDELVSRLRAHKAMKIYRDLDDGTQLYWLDETDTNPLCQEAANRIEELELSIKVLRHLADGQRMVQEDLERDLKTLRAQTVHS